jgi:hypothetical protein
VTQQLIALRSSVHAFDASVSLKGFEDSINGVLNAKKEAKQSALATYAQRFRDLDNELTNKSS